MNSVVKVPTLGESITEATIEKWLKKVGDRVELDEPIVSIESDKATVEVPAPAAGILLQIIRGNGDKVKIGEVIAEVSPGAAKATTPAGPTTNAAPPREAPGPVSVTPKANGETPPMGPSARKLIEENQIDPSAIAGSGPGGRILKEDVLRHTGPDAIPVRRLEEKQAEPAQQARPASAPSAGHEEQVVPMTPIRRTIAERLLKAKTSTAMLTTFNEIDMSRVMALREEYQPKFQERYGIKLGFMSFFVKACIEGLKLFPAVNAEIRGDSIAYKSYYDIGVAIGAGKGLTVPVVRDADALSFAEVEKKIAEYGKRAQENKLKLEELQGGTFTITNGGIYGSLLSTPILNLPQSAILGMHKIEKRAVVGPNDAIVVRPMMYVAVSYDHRIIDGREAVQFLVKVKECVEQPERILLEV